MYIHKHVHMQAMMFFFFSRGSFTVAMMKPSQPQMRASQFDLHLNAASKSK